MSLIPLAGARALSRVARRTTLVRGALGVALVGLVLLAAAVSRHPAHQQQSLPVHSGDMVVLDLSASISADTFNRIGGTLRKLVETGGRYGLVVFSNVAYEALPPGTPASALEPLIPYFTIPAQTSPGAAPQYPTNPWSQSFSSGTRISAGLDLAHQILVAAGLQHSSVVLISDLADDPQDVQRLNDVAIAEYGRGHTRLRVVALNAAPDDAAFFARITGAAIKDAPEAPAKASPPATTPPGRLPIWLILVIATVACLLAGSALWSARLRWAPFADAGSAP
jgi:hypothetical protein